MSALPPRDRLGAMRVFFSPETGEHAPGLASLLARVPAARARGLDPLGVDAAWGLVDAPERTCLLSVRAVPPGGSTANDRTATSSPTLEVVAGTLIAGMRNVLAMTRRPVVALGGGLDAPLAVAAARRAGCVLEHAIHLAVPDTSYDESARAREMASALGLSLIELRVTVDELAEALPRAVRLGESPLYNLHPVSRVLVARAAREHGFDALVTGDGADQAACGGRQRADYVPIVAAITRGCELSLASPFLEDVLVDLLEDDDARPDRTKRTLRDVGAAWGLPSKILEAPKVSSWAPPLPRAAFPSSAMVDALARALGRPLAWSDDDRANVGIASLACFVAAFEVPLGVKEDV